MPKEVIQYPVNDGFAGLSGTGTELSLHWSKEDASGYVQIGLTRHVFGVVDPDALASPVHADHSNCNECALAVERNAQRAETAVGAMIADSTDAPTRGEFDPPTTVFSVPLTRNEINKLIRVLRRARDQAFGEDA